MATGTVNSGTNCADDLAIDCVGAIRDEVKSYDVITGFVNGVEAIYVEICDLCRSDL